MAHTTNEQMASDTGSAGHFRVVLWFGAWGLAYLCIFLYRLDALSPNWFILAPLMLAPFFVGISSFRDLLGMRRGKTRETTAQIAIAAGAAIAMVAIVYFAWRYGAASVVRVVETYLLSALVPFSLVVALVALHVERANKVRVFVGIGGWRYLPVPSNSALLTDASSSPLRAQASAAKRER